MGKAGRQRQPRRQVSEGKIKHSPDLTHAPDSPDLPDSADAPDSPEGR